MSYIADPEKLESSIEALGLGEVRERLKRVEPEINLDMHPAGVSYCRHVLYSLLHHLELKPLYRIYTRPPRRISIVLKHAAIKVKDITPVSFIDAPVQVVDESPVFPHLESEDYQKMLEGEEHEGKGEEKETGHVSGGVESRTANPPRRKGKTSK